MQEVFQINPKNISNENADAGFVPMASITDGFSDCFTHEIRPWKTIKNGFTHFADNDVAVAKISPCLENRKSFVVKKLPNGIGAGTTELFVFRSSQIIPEYTLLFFKSDYFISSCVGTFNGVVGQQRASRNVIEVLVFPIPPKSEQYRIVQKVRTLFDVIDVIDNGKGALEESLARCKAKILELAIHGKLVPQDSSDEPAIELLRRINPHFVPSYNLHYTGVIPNGWLLLTYNDVADYINGRAFKPEEWESDGMPIIRIQNLNEPCAPYNYSSGSFEKQYHVQKGDLLFAWAASLGVYFWKGQDAWLNQHIFKVNPFSYIDKEYLYFALSASINDFYQKSHGSGMVHITRKQFVSMPLLLPPINEQKRIIKAVKAYYNVLDEIAAGLN